MKRLLLLGGGHAHVEVIRRFGDDPPPNTQVVLISPERFTAYSGMLPGYVAGHYQYHDCHIDLARLCSAARVSFRTDAAARLDTVTHCVECVGGERYEYDLASLDVGSTPPAHLIPGASEHALSVKPVARFIQGWNHFRATARASETPRCLVVIGGGAASIEIALAMRHRLAGDALPAQADIHIVTDAAALLTGHPQKARRVIERIMHERGIVVRTRCRVTRITPGIVHFDQSTLEVDLAVLATGAAAPSWLVDSGLALDEHGFVLVNDALQAVSCPEVFAAGDIASIVGFPLAKSGVFAVRQGPPLAENLRRALARRPLLSYRPQKTVLALISTGDRYAIASWNGVALAGSWIWRWKNTIDCRFMATYRLDSDSGKGHV